MTLRKAFAFAVAFAAWASSVAAQGLAPDIGRVLNDGFRQVFNALSGTYVKFGLTVIFLIMLFHNIFAAGLSRVSAFQGGGAANKYGKMVALSLSILSTVGLLFMGQGGPLAMMERILKSMGLIGLIAVAAAVFGITYYNFKEGEKTWPLTFFALGLTFLIFGLFTGSESWFSWGWLFIIIGIVWFLLSGNASSKGSEGKPGFWDRLFNRKKNKDTDDKDSSSSDSGNAKAESKKVPDKVTGLKGEVIPELEDTPNASGGAAK